MTMATHNGRHPQSLEGKAVIITGAAHGLGRAYAMDAARDGASVLLNDISEDVVDVAREIVAGGGRAAANVGSVATWQTAAAIIEDCFSAFGRLDGLVNNAGIINRVPSHEETEEQITALVSVNLMGALFVGTQALKIMAEQRSGSIVNMTSASQMGTPRVATYSATKGALASLTYTWAIDMSEFGVRVNGFAPSAYTQMSVAAGKPKSIRTPTAEANAPVVTYLLSDRSSGITGQVLQLRDEDIVLVEHPQLSVHAASSEVWSADLIASAFDPILRANVEQVGSVPGLAQLSPSPA
jgi:NAD(P)-dependent dehydrogenase (short-subunit alcohol dehydrogenase family)